MTGAGVISSACGFAIGREALKGITQPEIRPINNTGNQKKNNLPRRAQSLLLKEDDILADVKAQIEGDGKGNSSSQKNKALTSEETSEKPASQSPETQAGFPLKSVDRDVLLEVTSVRQQGGFFSLDVRLQNNSDRSVRFLYSFLNVTDDQGRVLSANTEGLPTDLPARSKSFQGTVKISSVSLEETSKLALTLTDYPEQRLQLQVSGIPVSR